MRWCLALASAICLFAVPAAGAKTLTKIVIVGARGTSVELTGLRPDDWASSPARVAPRGAYLLVYTLFDQDIAGQPGRYYADQHALCFSWDRRYAGRCYTAPAVFEQGVVAMPALSKQLPYVRKIWVAGKRKNNWSNGAISIELAFNRPSLAQPLATRPQKCRAVRASWSAAGRPSHFWACAAGIWAAGKLYPSGRLLF